MLARLERHDHSHVEDEQVMSESDEDISLALQPTNLDPSRPRSNYYANRFDEHPFSDPNLLDLDGPEKNAVENQDLSGMPQRAKGNGLPQSHWAAMEALIAEFCDSFSTRSSATVL